MDVRAVYQPFQWPRFGQIHLSHGVILFKCEYVAPISNPRFYVNVVPGSKKKAVTRRLSKIATNLFASLSHTDAKSTCPAFFQVMPAIGESPCGWGSPSGHDRMETSSLTVDQWDVSLRTLVKLLGSHLYIYWNHMWISTVDFIWWYII